MWQVPQGVRTETGPRRAQMGTTSRLGLQSKQSLSAPEAERIRGAQGCGDRAEPACSRAAQQRSTHSCRGGSQGVGRHVLGWHIPAGLMGLPLAPTAGGLELAPPAKSPAQCLINADPSTTLLTRPGRCHLLMREATEASG